MLELTRRLVEALNRERASQTPAPRGPTPDLLGCLSNDGIDAALSYLDDEESSAA